MKLTFLGTGTSVGVPSIGCRCKVCQSKNPRDKRLRASAMIETGQTRIVIDAGPDFRRQMLEQVFRKIDALLLTHIHYDHVGGIDDIRPFCQFGEVNVYADEITARGLMQTVPYCFAENRYPGSPKINLRNIRHHVPWQINELSVLPIRVMHGKMPITGYRIGNMAYITDMKWIEETEMQYLEGLDLLVVNALRFSPEHHSHQSVSAAVDFARKLHVKQTYLTHICHDIGFHEEVNRNLPQGIQLAYDGQVIEW
ncbi:MAG: MBL fold metallo-hydrolase [Prevotellaceae bacterium]|nr:MBL fold metallo-hydrolase [Prevotella sp.]MDD7258291.1 MBL fold metallo-hydrolase [Prevotellaceae bacterium]MDY6130228.1 MBL fold metallo-hydrolase [Prevotella sp.]